MIEEDFQKPGNCIIDGAFLGSNLNYACGAGKMGIMPNGIGV